MWIMATALLWVLTGMLGYVYVRHGRLDRYDLDPLLVCGLLGGLIMWPAIALDEKAERKELGLKNKFLRG